jgi:hypothetical protein
MRLQALRTAAEAAFSLNSCISMRLKPYPDTNLIVVYGCEYVGKDTSKPRAKVCQVWTDTWMKRNGTWQIIAWHDNRVECKQIEN